MSTRKESGFRTWSLLASLTGLLAVAGGWGGWLVSDMRADADAGQSAGEPVAEVGVFTISREELETSVADQLISIERSRHEALEEGLAALIGEKLLALEADARGISAEELLRVEIESQVEPPTSEQVQSFYAARRQRIGQPLEEVEQRIREYLLAQRQEVRRAEVLATLREKYEVVSHLEPFRVTVASDGFPERGGERAAVTIVEFSDFQCPYCSRLNPTLDRVREQYGQDVRLVFRQFPLPIHADADNAAEASLCAADHGKFWQMHDAMFADQGGLGLDQLVAKAVELGLDEAEFRACLEGGQHRAAVAADVEAGRRLGVNGTPALFVNGRLISGAVPFEDIATLVDDELERERAGATRQ